MQNKPPRPLFAQALSAVKKSFNSSHSNQKPQNNNNPLNTDNQFDDMSSGEQERLKELGVDLNKTKKIAKSNNTNHRNDSEEGTWKHDKFKSNPQKQHKSKLQPSPKPRQSFKIKFLTGQDYKKIYPLIKSQKAFIEEITDDYIKFSRLHAFNACKSIIKKQGIEFEEQLPKSEDGNELGSKEGKQSIFDRLKQKITENSAQKL